MNFPFQLLRKRLDKADINVLMKLKVFMFDCDGVLWRGSQPVQGAIDTLRYLKENGKSVYYCTNSSARSRKETQKRLLDFGIESNLDEIITSSYATARYLKEIPEVKEAYVIGEKGIYDELEEVGIRCHGLEDNDKKDISILSDMNPNIGAVVVGLDRNVNYVKLSRAASYIRDHNCKFVATNNDASDPNEEGLIVGAAGSMVSAVSTICGHQPDVILGKPNRTFVDIVRSHHPLLDPWDIMMVGDRLETDIALARQNGLKSLSVLTGITNESDIQNCNDSLAPQYFASSVAEIKDILVFGEDMTNEDEEKQALAELQRLKTERREMKRKEREKRKREKMEREKEIEKNKKEFEAELRKMDEEERRKNGETESQEKPKEVEEGPAEELLQGEKDLKIQK